MGISLARVLLGAGLVDAVTLGQASAISAEGGVPLVFALVRWRLVEAGQVAQVLAQALGVSVAALDELPGLPFLPVPRSVCARMRFLPVWRRGDVVGLAMSDPTDDDAVDQIVGACRVAVERILVNDDDLERALRHVYPRADELLPVRRPEGPSARPAGIDAAALPRTSSSARTVAQLAAPLLPTMVPSGPASSTSAAGTSSLLPRSATPLPGTPSPVLAPTRIVSGHPSTPLPPSSFAAPPRAPAPVGPGGFRSLTPFSVVANPLVPAVARPAATAWHAPTADPTIVHVVHGEATGVAFVGDVPEASAEMFVVSVVEGVPLEPVSEVFGSATIDMARPGVTATPAPGVDVVSTRVAKVVASVEPSQEMTLPSDMLAVVRLLVVAQGPVVDVVRAGLRSRLRELVVVGRLDEASALVGGRAFDEVIVIDPPDTVSGSQQLAVLASRVRRGVLVLGGNRDVARLPKVRHAPVDRGDDLVGLIAECLHEAARS